MTLGPPVAMPPDRQWGHAKVAATTPSTERLGLTMCIAMPARILAIDAGDAVVEIDGRVRRASMLRLPDVAVGDWALVAAGTVLRRLDPREAAELERLLRGAMTEPTGAPLRGGSR